MKLIARRAHQALTKLLLVQQSVEVVLRILSAILARRFNAQHAHMEPIAYTPLSAPIIAVSAPTPP